MIAYILIACVAIPLVMLIVDVMTPNKRDAAGPAVHDEIRPHVAAVATDRRDVHRADAVAPEAAPRPPRIAPGDGMVYRPAQRAARPR